MEIEVKKTTYSVDGCKEPCYLVTNGYITIRISTCYHLIGSNTLYLTEFHDGKWNGEEEVKGDFKSLTKKKALELAKSWSVYI